MTDEMLRIAARDSCRAFVESLEADFDPRAAYVPSAAFRRKLRALCRRAEHPYLHAALRRAAAFLLVCLLSGGVFLSVDAQARDALQVWLRTIVENSVFYRFTGEENQGDFPVCRLGWIPEGVVLERETDQPDKGVYRAYYVNSETGYGFVFYYQWMADGLAAGLSTENMIYQRTVVNGMPADYYESTLEGDSNLLMWFDEEHHLAFSINSRLDRETIFRIAEGVTLTEVP